MTTSRRDIGLLLAAMNVPGLAQGIALLPSKMYRHEDLPVKASGTGPNKSRAILDGKTHTGFRIEIHESELGAGLAPHPPHTHVHEELTRNNDSMFNVSPIEQCFPLCNAVLPFLQAG